MTEEFKTDTKSLTAIFGDTDSFYKIPDYQRPYSWENEHVETLWDDLLSAFENNQEDEKIDKNYFLGGIVLTPSSEKGYSDVIDGQQRLTTLMILFCVFRDFSNLDGDYKKKIEKKIEDDGDPRLKLLTEIGKRNEFGKHILEGIKLEENQKALKKQRQDKYFNTTFIFKEKLEEINSKEKIKQFIDYLLEKVKIIKITCSDRAFAIKLFQIINTRGLDLSQTDLIKSFLLSKLRNDRHEQFINTWDKIRNKIKDTTNLVNLFTAFQYYLLAKNPKRTLSEEIENQFEKKYKDKDSNNFILEVEKFTEKYLEIYEDRNNFSFRYLKHQGYWQPILTTAKCLRDENYYKSISKILKQFYYLYWIAGYTTPKIKQTSFNLIEWIKNGKSIDEIKEKLKEKIENDNVINWCKIALFDEDVYGKGWLKPLLILIESNQIDDSNAIDYIEIDKKIQIEHILPVSKKHHSTYKFENHDNYINKLPNLTLLSGKKNIQAGDNPFDGKKEIYRGKGEDGITGFKITQQVIENYNSWGIQEFNKRKEFLQKEINKLLIDDFKNN